VLSEKLSTKNKLEVWKTKPDGGKQVPFHHCTSAWGNSRTLVLVQHMKS